MIRITLHKLFVYGTLKLDDEDTHEISARMWNVGQFPCVKLGGEETVPGQIIDVTTLDLEKLDRYEGVPILYTRQQTTAKGLTTDDEETVWVYEWSGNTENLRRIATWDN
jgi:gamma-glutamylcyclotransferase (GGCT)/AIG2-like uncharacterized protein YtfP